VMYVLFAIFIANFSCLEMKECLKIIYRSVKVNINIECQSGKRVKRSSVNY